MTSRTPNQDPASRPPITPNKHNDDLHAIRNAVTAPSQASQDPKTKNGHSNASNRPNSAISLKDSEDNINTKTQPFNKLGPAVRNSMALYRQVPMSIYRSSNSSSSTTQDNSEANRYVLHPKPKPSRKEKTQRKVKDSIGFMHDIYSRHWKYKNKQPDNGFKSRVLYLRPRMSFPSTFPYASAARNARHDQHDFSSSVDTGFYGNELVLFRGKMSSFDNSSTISSQSTSSSVKSSSVDRLDYQFIRKSKLLFHRRLSQLNEMVYSRDSQESSTAVDSKKSQVRFGNDVEIPNTSSTTKDIVRISVFKRMKSTLCGCVNEDNKPQDVDSETSEVAPSILRSSLKAPSSKMSDASHQHTDDQLQEPK